MSIFNKINQEPITENQYVLSQQGIQVDEVFDKDPLIVVQEGGFGWGNCQEDLMRGLNLFKDSQFIVFTNNIKIGDSKEYKTYKLTFRDYKTLMDYYDFCQLEFGRTLDDEFTIYTLPDYHWFKSHCGAISSNINPKTNLSYAIERLNMLDKLTKEEVFLLKMSELNESVSKSLNSIKLWSKRVVENPTSMSQVSMGYKVIDSNSDFINKNIIKINNLISEYTHLKLKEIPSLNTLERPKIPRLRLVTKIDISKTL